MVLQSAIRHLLSTATRSWRVGAAEHTAARSHFYSHASLSFRASWSRANVSPPYPFFAGGALKAVRPVRFCCCALSTLSNSFDEGPGCFSSSIRSVLQSSVQRLHSRRQVSACTPVVRCGNFIGGPHEIGATEHIVRMSIKWCYRAHCVTTLCEALAVLDPVGTRKF